MKNFLKDYFLETAFALLLIRALITGSSFPESLIAISLIVSICYIKHYLIKQKAELTSELEQEVDTMKKKVDAIAFNVGLKREQKK